ncbi:Fucose 4-O-acetylase [Terribacillus aidingensis]|uniref:Fucose 4-O-acetylase n=1 Tax=Terribacillus aidingensis TaxID=586416 RepID=A0A285N4J9_9BACI|nr:acyltransferase family protein [Terribacillus aidingensis]SNZ04360.1 Fucose 4-O-acetylase [Terribacillus aidingensis]
MERDVYFDNARWLMITLVVFGHLIQPYQNMIVLQTSYTWIYTFHMPVFIFLAGFFAKGMGHKAAIEKLVKKLLLPYLFFQVIYTMFYYAIGKEGWLQSVLIPQWALWFLLSLFCWHMLLIPFKYIRPLTGIPLAVLIGVAAGYVDTIGSEFSLSRTFVFFPFFLIGYWATKDQLAVLRRMPIRFGAGFVLISTAIVLYHFPNLSTGWLLGSKSFAEIGADESGGLIRILIYVISAVMMASVLSLIPAKETPFSKYGQRTLYVYLLHGFAIQYIRAEDIFEVSNTLDILGLLFVTFSIVWVLSQRWILRIWKPLIELKSP